MKEETGSIYYHGTDEASAKEILRAGFKAGTYFTWDLHSALVMGGMWVFGVYFENKNPSNYWEYISDTPINKERILYIRKFIIDCVYDNVVATDKLQIEFLKELHGNDMIFCTTCDGHGQLNKNIPYQRPTHFDVCPVCEGFGCLTKEGKKLNE